MADKVERMVKDFVRAINERDAKAVKPYDTEAQVIRVDGSTAWVHIEGGVDETPVTRTLNANPGDKVHVRVSGGRAWITGNSTSPPTDDTRANIAYIYAGRANDTAIEAADEANAARRESNLAKIYADVAQREAARAMTEADNAAEAARIADGHAAEAKTSADAAREDAGIAKTQAQSANKYANSALDQLGIVQDVVGVLNWASEHGSFTHTEDTQIVEHKVYFVYDAVAGDYMPVVDPQQSQLANYYELSVDEAMETYILSHLAVTSRGLWVLPSGIGSAQSEQFAPGYKMLLASGQTPGMYLYDQNGTLVTSYGPNSIEFDSGRQFHIGTQDAYILFTPASGSTGASISIGGANITLGDNRTLDQVIATVDNTLIYDHTYTYGDLVDGKPTTATFTAFLYRGGVDVKYEMDGDEPKYPPSQFTWYLKKEDTNGTKEVPIINSQTGTNEGYTCTVNLADCGYGAEVIGKFTSLDNAQALDTSGNNLTNVDNEPLSVRATGDSIRVRDLTTSSIIFPTEKLMVVGSEDEHLVTIQTLAQYILESETHILYCGTATELV